MRIKPEILAPVGSYEALYSAINNGADAVYFGGRSFGARAYATNFSNEEIKDIIDYCHIMDVLVYVTVNTLIKESEFNEAVEFVRFLYENNVDAIIMQDFGLIKYCKDVFVDLDIHASTQINTHTYHQALFLKSIGIKRVVLARETDPKEIKKITSIEGLEVEVFVHGALCVSYSGLCFMSSFNGGRSGNRGRCAQPCRKYYSLIDNEENIVDEGYLLSTKDLMTINNIKDIIDCGVTSLKIEGRMKRPEYVGLTVRSYKGAINGLVNEEITYNLALMYNRLFTKGFINNATNSDITNTSSPNHIGVKIGEVTSSSKNYAYIKLTHDLNNQDSIRIVGDEEDAVTINGMHVNDVLVTTASKGMTVKVRTHKPVSVASSVLKTTDYVLVDEINKVKPKKIGIDGRIYVDNGFLALELNDGKNKIVILSDELVSSSNNPNYYLRFTEQINKTNDSNYYFNNLINEANGVFLQISNVNELRRRALSELDNIRKTKYTRRYGKYKPYKLNSSNIDFLIYVKVRDINQLNQALELNIPNIVVDNKKLLEYGNGVSNIHLISPRIKRDDTIDIVEFSSYDILSQYSNVFNSYAMNFYYEKGVKNIALSIELNKLEIKDMLSSYTLRYKDTPRVTIMAYGYQEMMITKHCLINKSNGLNKLNCKLCYIKQYYLKDDNDRYPLIDDGACNLKILKTKPLDLIKYLSEVKEMGINSILLDFSIEKDISIIYNKYKLNLSSSEDDFNYIGHYEEGVI